MQNVRIDERIRVGVAFDSRRVRPMWFLWHNRYYRVRTVEMAWSSSVGRVRIHHYSVTDGSNTYELRFSSDTLEWTLAKVCLG